MGATDTDLLRDYAEGSEAAFAALVARHLNLVYSAARRQVRSPQLAEEVVQSVFCELARQAGRFPRGTPLNGWLYLVTRRMAIDAMRRESRRLAREHAAADLSPMHATPSVWSRVEPVLDEAMAALSATDRSALLLRFFENKSLREVGAALGTSDDAAQKRVTRAIDQLRGFFLRRGIAVTAAGLATDLSAHALQIAPAGLGATISTLASGKVAVAVMTAGKTTAMSVFQKPLAATALALAVGAGLYEVSLFARQQADLGRLPAQAAGFAAQLRQATDRQAVVTTRLKSVEDEIDARLTHARSSVSDAGLEAQMRTWLGKVDRLKRTLEASPGHRIPEMALLTDSEWLQAATSVVETQPDGNIPRTLSMLRGQAEAKMARRIREALLAYVEAKDDLLPSRVEQLLPFFDPPIDPDWLARYEMWQTGKASNARAQSGIVGIKRPADLELDACWIISLEPLSNISAMGHNINEAQRLFYLAHRNQGPSPSPTTADLLPYLKWPVSEEVLRNSPLLRLEPAPAPRPR